MGGCPDMTSCTSIAKVRGNPRHAEYLYHSLDFVLLPCKACSPLTPVFPSVHAQGVLCLIQLHLRFRCPLKLCDETVLIFLSM